MQSAIPFSSRHFHDISSGIWLTGAALYSRYICPLTTLGGGGGSFCLWLHWNECPLARCIALYQIHNPRSPVIPGQINCTRQPDTTSQLRCKKYLNVNYDFENCGAKRVWGRSSILGRNIFIHRLMLFCEIKVLH